MIYKYRFNTYSHNLSHKNTTSKHSNHKEIFYNHKHLPIIHPKRPTSPSCILQCHHIPTKLELQGNKINYDSVASVDLITNDMVDDFMNSRNEVGHFTQPSNINEDENQVQQRRSTRFRQVHSYGTDHHLPRLGQNFS